MYLKSGNFRGEKIFKDNQKLKNIDNKSKDNTFLSTISCGKVLVKGGGGFL